MELSFIQACLTHCLYPDRPLPEPPAGLDWSRVYELLAWHRLAGLFCVLGKEHPGLWPAELRERLRADRYLALLRGDRCTKQVSTALGALRQADLPVIVLKGWAFISTLYGDDHGQRTYEDIDLLVLPQDAARAEAILHDLGYRGLIGEPWPGYHRRYRNGQTYGQLNEPTALGRSFAVAIHWGLLGLSFCERRMAVKQFFERAQPLQVAGVEVRGLAAEDDLVYACGHLALHHTYDEALFRYYEIASGILRTGPAFDWEAVTVRASAWWLTLPVQRVLARLEALWPGIVPTGAGASISKLRPTPTERLFHDWMVKEQENHTVRALLDWLGLPGPGKRVRFLLETAFPSPAYLRQRYGPATGGLWPLLYFHRVAAAVRHVARSGQREGPQ